ncbi:hypothetical protein GOP47_0025556 [Adiantum capillus-veneris]|uniref:Initiator tRNA phosphoribosyl transferase n=1 Tax=Adiantum capillus-veneris TaxID=13818 RepID=A0A9D4U0X4_ADICA|nr:hypothetical protein GOP47_0025556 [Adiantum capillus-veneris]
MELLSTSAAQRGGCFIVDATRQGKRFPDSFSKTIPIWACVLNRAVYQYRQRAIDGISGDPALESDHVSKSEIETWDCSLHLPLWISDTEREKIERQIDKWVCILWAANADIGCLSKALKKPLQPLWISQNTVVWLNEVPESATWTFTPIVLVSASHPLPCAQRMCDGGSGWNYIPGAADDEESWARGLTPALFWKHALALIEGSTESCTRMVAEIVERERVLRAYRGLQANQIKVKASRKSCDNGNESQQQEQTLCEVHMKSVIGHAPASPTSSISWIGETYLAVGSASCGQSAEIGVDCVIECGVKSHWLPNKANLFLPLVDSKHERFSLQKNLFQAMAFAKESILQQRSILIICANGEDLSVCVCLTILLALFNPEGAFDGGSHFDKICVTKWDVRQRLVYVCNFAANARPSRGNLRQVYQYLLSLKNPNRNSLEVNSFGAATEGE